MIDPQSLAAGALVGGAVFYLLAMCVERRIWRDTVARAWADRSAEKKRADDLYRVSLAFSKKLAKYEADEERRLAPLKAANRKRHEEALARKGVA